MTIMINTAPAPTQQPTSVNANATFYDSKLTINQSVSERVSARLLKTISMILPSPIHPPLAPISLTPLLSRVLMANNQFCAIEYIQTTFVTLFGPPTMLAAAVVDFKKQVYSTAKYVQVLIEMRIARPCHGHFPDLEKYFHTFPLCKHLHFIAMIILTFVTACEMEWSYKIRYHRHSEYIPSLPQALE